MGNLVSSNKIVSGIVDLPNGSQVLDIATGVFLPKNCVITRFWFNPIDPCTGAMGAQAALIVGNTGTPIKLMLYTNIADFVVGAIIPGIDFNASPTAIGNADQQIFFSINGAPWLTGKIYFCVEYTYGDFKFVGPQIINPTAAGGFTSETGVVAHFGGGQPAATPLTKDYAKIDTAMGGNDSVKLKPAIASARQVVLNDTLNNVDVFTQAGENFQGLLPNIALSLIGGAQMEVFCFVNGTWVVL